MPRRRSRRLHKPLLLLLISTEPTGTIPSGSPLCPRHRWQSLRGHVLGGTPTNCLHSVGDGCGTVFKLTPAGEFTTLYNFCSQPKLQRWRRPGESHSGVRWELLRSNVKLAAFPVTAMRMGAARFSNSPQWSASPRSTPFASWVAAKTGRTHWLIQATTEISMESHILEGAHQHGTLFELSGAGKFTTLHSFCAQTGCPTAHRPDL